MHCKFIKLPILIKLLTFLLLGIVFDTQEGGGACLCCDGSTLSSAGYRFRYPRGQRAATKKRPRKLFCVVGLEKDIEVNYFLFLQ